MASTSEDPLTVIVLDEFETLFAFKPEDLATTAIAHDEQDYVDSFYDNVHERLGLEPDDERPATLGAFIEHLRSSWDGKTGVL